jgi:hypothetical protein
MPYNITLQPNDFTAAYSAVPVQVFSDEYNDYDQFKYLINLCWNVNTSLSGSTAVSYPVNGSIYTRFTTTSNHKFNIGDKVLLYNPSATTINGYYDVIRVPSPTEFVITLEPSIPINSYVFEIGVVIKYKIDPNLTGYGNVDLSNTLKDFVSQNLSANTTNYGLSYNGGDTMFEYSIYAGQEITYQVEFVDNFFSGGTVGFNNTGITTTTGVLFEVGDEVIIEQDLSTWNYTDNYFSNGYVGFTGSTQHSFLSGQTITVVGQSTFPFYNGQTTILSAGTYNIVIDKAWQGSTPTEPGSIFGTPRPSYNTVGTITEIFVHPTLGLCIVTDIPFATSSVPISGVIRYADGRLSEIPVQSIVRDKRTYNAHIDRPLFTTSYFNDYVLQSGVTNNLSTILTPSKNYRIENTSIGFLLTHCKGTGSFVDGMAYVFKDSNNSTLGSLVIEKPSGSTDFYSPIGLTQISQSPKIEITGSFTGYSGNVNTYEMFAVDLSGMTYFQQSEVIDFELNNDCSMYQLYHIMWKDSYGSFITYPFKYISRETIDTSKVNYYQTEGRFSSGAFQYNQWDRGTNDFYSKSREVITVNSGWLYEFERELIKDLIQSPSVYIQTPENKLYPVQLQETNLEIYKKINEDLFQYTLNCVVSYNEVRF